MLSFKQCFLFSSFPLLLVFVVGGLGFEFCVFVAGWRHALRSEWPFIIIIIISVGLTPIIIIIIIIISVGLTQFWPKLCRVLRNAIK